MVVPDEGAHYERVSQLNLDEVPLTVATPGDSRDRLSLVEASGGGDIHSVAIASCPGGSFSELRAPVDVLHGRQLHEAVRLTVTPSSEVVEAEAESERVLAVSRDLGPVVSAPGCGHCIGNGPGLRFPGEATARATNRGFDRRMGAPSRRDRERCDRAPYGPAQPVESIRRDVASDLEAFVAVGRRTRRASGLGLAALVRRPITIVVTEQADAL